jgi:uncharacterized protein
MESLLAADADVNAAQADGMTALHWAVRHGDGRVAKKLLEKGANANAENRYGIRPLFLACMNGDATITALLLEAGADANATIAGGETSLMTAARTGRVDVVKLLLSRGADVNARERKGQTALMWAAAEGHVEVIQALVAAKADVRRSIASGFTALFFAVREGKPEAVMALLDAGSDVNDVLQPRSRDPKKSTTALLLAIENGHFELAAALVDRGARADGAPAGYTPLHAITWVRKPIRGDGDPPPSGSGTMTSLDMVRKLAAAGATGNIRPGPFYNEWIRAVSACGPYVGPAADEAAAGTGSRSDIDECRRDDCPARLHRRGRPERWGRGGGDGAGNDRGREVPAGAWSGGERGRPKRRDRDARRGVSGPSQRRPAAGGTGG